VTATTATTAAAIKSTSNQSLIEPEQLISKAEAESLISESVAEGEKTEQKAVGMKQIFYDAINEDSKLFLQVSITQQGFMKEGSSQTPEKIYQQLKSDQENEIAVTGIGDDAMICTPGLHILVDGYYLVISAGNTSLEATRDIIKKAGALAVDNLKALE